MEMTAVEMFKRLEVTRRERDKWLKAVPESKLERLRERESRRTAWLPGVGWVYQGGTQ